MLRHLMLALLFLGLFPIGIFWGSSALLTPSSQLFPISRFGVAVLWAAVLPMQLQVALALVRRTRPIPDYRAIRAVPGVLVAVGCNAALLSASRLIAHASGLPSVVRALLTVFMTGAVLGFACRTFTWAPLIVDKQLAAWPALKLGLQQTRGYVFRITTVIFLVGAPPVVLSVITPEPLALFVWFLVMPVATIACARVYDHLLPSNEQR